MTDPWTLFTSDRWVLYYLILYHAHCYGGVRGALIILWCGVWMSSICTVLLHWAPRHFRVKWMNIVTRILADYFYWLCREMYSSLKPWLKPHGTPLCVYIYIYIYTYCGRITQQGELGLSPQRVDFIIEGERCWCSCLLWCSQSCPGAGESAQCSWRCGSVTRREG